MDVLAKEKKINELEIKISEINDESLRDRLKEDIKKYKNDIMHKLTPWDRVQIARHSARQVSSNYIEALFDDFMELHGDRLYSDDESIIGGIGTLNGLPVTVIAQQKGKSTEDNIKRNFAMPHPEGYRKSIRLMQQAEKFNRPIITFVDTPGAYPGMAAEERGQGEAIAKSIMYMSSLTVPVICVVIGEGGSGGALALSVANKIIMLENSIYSVISPEGFASILWKDSKRASEAAEALKLTSYDLKEWGIVDKIIKEPIGGVHNGFEETARRVKQSIIATLNELKNKSRIRLREERYSKFRNLGFFQRFNLHE
ncbi:acetyl-CoA carboxylase carboxyltransferase subunit alpha [Mycoplasmatota bacterium]|nr:acetyl-CoA carboxylase carboxyltransferase subunit alpha [Mycoplasmatota bacterium]